MSPGLSFVYLTHSQLSNVTFTDNKLILSTNVMPGIDKKLEGNSIIPQTGEKYGYAVDKPRRADWLDQREIPDSL